MTQKTIKTKSKEYQITGRIPHGSVLGFPLWNIMYDDLLKIQLPPGPEMVPFADDAGLIQWKGLGGNSAHLRRLLRRSAALDEISWARTS